MRKVLGFALIFSGTIFCIFVFNIVMYATIPEYRGVIVSAVERKDDIPVIRADTTVTEITDSQYQTPLLASPQMQDTSLIYTDNITALTDDSEEISTEPESADSLTIINREYHEDCGTGKGYWVVTYSDGSTTVE